MKKRHKKTISLNGTWKFKAQGKNETLEAIVPGCVHTDLLSNQKIKDPYYRDNEQELMWIGETNWEYFKEFDLDEKTMSHDHLFLKCHGLDTDATITLNGTVLGNTDNQYRTWEFDIKPYLKLQNNLLKIAFESPLPRARQAQKERFLLPDGLGEYLVDGGNRIRKSPCNFGWDWGPMCVTSGVWKPIEIIAFDDIRLLDTQVHQTHLSDGSVSLHVDYDLEVHSLENHHVHVEVFFENHSVASTRSLVSGKHGQHILMIESPELWWPSGMGEQLLYDVQVTILQEDIAVDRVEKTIGLRTIQLKTESDQWGESFHFEVNGVPFFAKGANWIPADTFVNRTTDEHLLYLLQSAVDANMNMIRVWGGGVYESDYFYDCCDRLGLCVWQDFMFACAAYPAFDKDFVKTFKAEATEQIKRLRHHASLSLWCGNNELEYASEKFLGNGNGQMTWEEYQFLFDELTQSLVKTLDPERSYWPSSPHSPVGNREDHNNPNVGDAHLWDVWHGRQPFEWYHTSQHRFVSEFGFQSFPEPQTVEGYTIPEDHNITSFVMEHHQRALIGNSVIMDYMLSWFKVPKDFEMTLWLSQILQGMSMKFAVEHWRRLMPRSMGALYWQLNDCWPGPSWSSIDYHGRWKALHHIAKDFNAPLLVSGTTDWEAGTAEVYVSNDHGETFMGTVTGRWVDMFGEIIQEESHLLEIEPRSSQQITTMKFEGKLDGRSTILHLELRLKDTVVSQNVLFFSRPKHLKLQAPQIEQQIVQQENGEYSVTFLSKHLAFWVWPEIKDLDATFSQRFFHLFPDRPTTINITPKQGLSLPDFRKNLQVSSLIETF